MSDSLTLYISHYGSDFTWLFRRQDLPDELGSGDADALAGSIGGGNHQARLILGGPQTVVRRLSYTDAEKRHLRKLMPFQLEEDVIGDIDQFHFALGTPADGKINLAYTERGPLRELFDTLAAMNVEVIQALPAALLPSYPSLPDGDAEAPDKPWAIHWQNQLVSVRYDEGAGFTIPSNNIGIALELLLKSQNRVSPPQLLLSAPDENQLAQLQQHLPGDLSEATCDTRICSLWDFEPDSGAIDLCQGEFSQRLPIERWWRNWRRVAYAAAAAAVVYLVTLLFSIHQLQNENLEIRRNIEQVFRTVVPNGPAIDPERRLRIMARDLEPSTGGSAVMALLDRVLPAVQEGDVTLKGIYYTSENAELSLNLQASSFNAIESLRASLENSGLSAELLSASAQGNTHSARIKVKQELP